ncbi:transaldolase [Occultella glacieicola]|uniref:Transaldolase n=1 Tax=Occultella glacieicola TaxID=2518684 RepID=A0ABY2DWE2_9MICO|nr:transaldolase [Occultella glacieicola]TDE88115.1 transaldolase [Occultella glacieicola]
MTQQTQQPGTTSDALSAISAAGVSVWLDDLSRDALQSGALKNLIDTRSVVGVTTNPTIFAKSIENGDAYEPQLRELAAAGASLDEAVLKLTTADVRDACDLFADIHAATGGQDGRVSIEVDPRLARETEATIASAHTLWETVDRPNLHVKIPATVEGLPAITAAIGAGISVNVTLVFSLDRFRAVAQAYVDGLELAHQAGRDLSTIRSVSSLFLSRIDTQVDKALDEIGTDEARALRGKAAIANARLAYEVYEEIFSTPRFEALAVAGAHTQRPLWASTGTKDPAYPDTMYVDELVVADVVNTMPGKTLEAVADHSRADGTDTVHGTFEDSRQILDSLERLGVPYGKILEGLEEAGVASFEKSWDELLKDVTDGLAAAGS